MKTLDDITAPFDPGSVWLVGAGPGDPGLLTLHAYRALQQADIIVYDALVDASCLELARPGVALEYAGKRGGKPSAKQRDISLRLVELARKGLRVLRLKGGDPFVFGRGGEEAMTLAESGVPFRIVPGITAGIGGLAYAGIPVTHRETNHVVSFLTGHDSGGIVPDTIDWASLAKSSPVIVMYMVMKHIVVIADKLIAAGRSPDEPAAIVVSATTGQQRSHVSTLSRIAAEIAEKQFEPPAILVIGHVVDLRPALDWQSRLSGQAEPVPMRAEGELKTG